MTAPAPRQRDAASDTGHWNFSACVDRFGNIHADVNVGGGPSAASHTTGASGPPSLVATLLRELAGDIELAPYRLPDGTWSCTRNHVTRPCGNCDGCRYIASVNAARREESP